jgi:fructuronate reductase/mannitol 2-dehydrogenase
MATPDAPAAAPLTQQTLPDLSDRVAVPTYDRAALTPSVVHISVGGFSRAHQMVYFDEIAENRISDEWGVVGIGLHRRQMKDALEPQDLLYTVVERSAEQERARVVGAMIRYHFAPEDPAAVLDVLADERTRLVTMTITGTAYRLDPETGEFDPDDDELRWDLDHPDEPRSVFGVLVGALDRRRRAGIAPFTLLSCDNMRHNGEAARTAVVGFAALRDEGLATWIAANVAFPSSMVDRITPQTSPEEREEIVRTFGVDDQWPVVTEPFSQWIVEDAFCNGRPPLDQVGVRIVDDVARYELMKTRLLNASHSALGYLGYLAGYSRTDEVMADPVFHDYIARLMDQEVSPLLPDPHGVDLADYRRTLLERFANPAIGDQLERLCGRGSTKVPNYLLPSLRDALDQGRPHALLTLAVAGWCRYLRGVDYDGNPIEIKDARREQLQELARAGGRDPRPLLAERSVFDSLGERAAFVEELERTLERLDRDGVRATVAAHLTGAFEVTA